MLHTEWDASGLNRRRGQDELSWCSRCNVTYMLLFPCGVYQQVGLLLRRHMNGVLPLGALFHGAVESNLLNQGFWSSGHAFVGLDTSRGQTGDLKGILAP